MSIARMVECRWQVTETTVVRAIVAKLSRLNAHDVMLNVMIASSLRLNHTRRR